MYEVKTPLLRWFFYNSHQIGSNRKLNNMKMKRKWSHVKETFRTVFWWRWSFWLLFFSFTSTLFYYYSAHHHSWENHFKSRQLGCNVILCPIPSIYFWKFSAHMQFSSCMHFVFGFNDVILYDYCTTSCKLNNFSKMNGNGVCF